MLLLQNEFYQTNSQPEPVTGTVGVLTAILARPAFAVSHSHLHCIC